MLHKPIAGARHAQVHNHRSSISVRSGLHARPLVHRTRALVVVVVGAKDKVDLVRVEDVLKGSSQLNGNRLGRGVM